MKKMLYLFLVSLVFCSCTSSKDDDWVSLFNGKDLSGWKQLNGEAKYEVVDGMIVGTTVVNTPNSFLCTEEEYSDFIFEVDLLLEESMNSGIQFRSESREDYRDGRVHGYQCEVDPSDRAWSGGIYDEARRGWLYPVELNPDAKSAFKMNEWNHYRIECVGPSIKTWINGIPVAHLIDNMTMKGFIALQVHGIGNNEERAGHRIKWKNIRIKTENLEPAFSEGIYVVNMLPNNLSKAEEEKGFKLLFDGNSTANFKSARGDNFPSKGWEVKDGVLTVLESGGDPEKKGGDIVTKEEFGPFELKFDFNFTKCANSGIKYGLGNNGPSIGLEYQIIDGETHSELDDNKTLASLYDLIPANTENRFVNGPGEWNRGRIVLKPDNTVQHWLNGRKVVEYTRGSEDFNARVKDSKFAKFENFGMAARTPILFQDHNCTVHFRSIKIREL